MINFVSYDPKQIVDEMIKNFESEMGETLYPADERRIFLQQLVPSLMSLKADINNTGNQNLLRYAKGAMLDELGEMFDVGRIAPKKANCIIQYNLPTAVSFDISIPKGSRVTTDGTSVFLTDNHSVITAGETKTTVNATALLPGDKYNGLVPHQISNMVDVIPYIASVYNITSTDGGGDTESDDNYRNHIRLSYQQFSTAGSEKAYQFWAKSVGDDIADVSVENASAGVVHVYVLPKDSFEASQALIDRVAEGLSSDKHRPLTDSVTVKSAEKIEYDIDLVYYINAKDSADEQVIIANTSKAVNEFNRYTSESLGISINPDYLRSLMFQSGVYKIDLIKPEYSELLKRQVGVVKNITTKYGGLKSCT